MVAMIWLISWLPCRIVVMAAWSSFIFSLLRETWVPAVLAFSLAAWAISRSFCAPALISLAVAESSSTALACSVAPWARAWAPEDT